MGNNNTKMNSDSIAEQLKQCDKSTKAFSLDGLTKLCKVVDVYDGDTCRVVFEHNGNFNKWTVRMTGYDTPEIRPRKTVPNREEVKAKARASRDFLKSKIMGYPEQLVFIRCSCFDKYGRLLGEIFTDKHCKENINQLMITEGYGYKYDGGTKKK